MYGELLAQLLGSESKQLVLAEPTITASAVRQGLQTALDNFNKSMELMDLPPTTEKLTVSQPVKGGNITVKLKASASNSYEGKFKIL